MKNIISCINVDTFLNAAYWVGLIACVATGLKKSRSSWLPLFYHVIANSFLGGVLRDTCLLKIYPWLLSASALPDIFFVIVVSIVCNSITNRMSNPQAVAVYEMAINIFDAVGLAAFICIGADKALDLGCNMYIAILCAYVTATWGGVLANIHDPKAILLPSQLWYYLVVLLNSILYCYCHNASILFFTIPSFLLLGRIYRKS